jgi:hypothetical protein
MSDDRKFQESKYVVCDATTPGGWATTTRNTTTYE